jgi:hypothetical protein
MEMEMEGNSLVMAAEELQWMVMEIWLLWMNLCFCVSLLL